MIEDILSTAARIAAGIGGLKGLLIAFAIVLVGATLIVLEARYGGVFKIVFGAVWTYFRGLKPTETTLNPDGSHKEGTGAPPMKVDPDGSIPLKQEPPKDYL